MLFVFFWRVCLTNHFNTGCRFYVLVQRGLGVYECVYMCIYIYIYTHVGSGLRQGLAVGSPGPVFLSITQSTLGSLGHSFKSCLANLIESFTYIYALFMKRGIWNKTFPEVQICWETLALRLWGPMVLRSWPQAPHWAKLCPWAKAARGPGDLTKPYEIYCIHHHIAN